MKVKDLLNGMEKRVFDVNYLADICTLYAFGSKSFVPRRSDLRFHGRPLPFYHFEPKERLGAAAEFKVGENAVIGISVEHVGY